MQQQRHPTKFNLLFNLFKKTVFSFILKMDQRSFLQFKIVPKMPTSKVLYQITLQIIIARSNTWIIRRVICFLERNLRWQLVQRQKYERATPHASR